MKAYNPDIINLNTINLKRSSSIKTTTEPTLNKVLLPVFAFIYSACLFDATAQSSNQALSSNQNQLNNQQQTQSNPATSNKKAVKSPYIIETLVQGSQEQPNVIYITPWQDNQKAVSIQGQSLQVLLPTLTPVNPKIFKQQLNNYYQSNN